MRRIGFSISLVGLLGISEICCAGIAWAEAATAVQPAPPAATAQAAPPAAPPPPAATPEAANAAAPPAVAADAVVSFVRAQTELGCDYRSHVVLEQNILVACGAAGLVVLAPRGESFVVVERRPTGGGAAMDFFEQGGAVWARVVEDRAIQVGPGRIVARGSSAGAVAVAPAAPTAPAASPSATVEVARPPLTGHVVTLRGKSVTVNLGRENGVKLGDKIAFFEAASTNGDSYEKSAVVGVVVDAAPETSTVRIGMGEVVTKDALVAISGSAITGSRVNPPRSGDLWELSALVRPGLSLGDVGGLVEAELEGGYRTKSWAFGAVVSPIGFGGSRGHDLLAFGAAHVYGAFDGQVFAAGIGIGVTGVNDTNGLADGGTGLSVHEMLRVGSIDGLNLTVRTSIAIFRSTIQFANVDAYGQVSVANDAWLVLRGGGGVVGYGYAEVAVRALTAGNGGAGSSFIEVGLGGSASFVNTCHLTPVVSQQSFNVCDNQNFVLAGPHLSLGMEWRL